MFKCVTSRLVVGACTSAGHLVKQYLQVPDLVATRRVFLAKGVAFVPSDLLSSVVAGLFREHITKMLIMTAGRRATSGDGQENSRLAPILTSLTTRCFPCGSAFSLCM